MSTNLREGQTEINLSENYINNEYAEEHSLTYKSIFEPYQGWLSKRLYIRKLLPSRIHKSNSLERINFIECESHRDMLLKVLKNLE